MNNIHVQTHKNTALKAKQTNIASKLTVTKANIENSNCVLVYTGANCMCAYRRVCVCVSEYYELLHPILTRTQLH